MNATASKALEQAVARLATSRLRLACALAREAGSQASAAPDPSRQAGPEAGDAEDRFEGVEALLARSIRDGVAREALVLLRRWLGRRPWQAAGAAALFGAGLVPWLAWRLRGVQRRPAGWLAALSLWARWLDRCWPDRPEGSACRDLVADDEPLKRTTGTSPGVFR